MDSSKEAPLLGQLNRAAFEAWCVSQGHDLQGSVPGLLWPCWKACAMLHATSSPSATGNGGVDEPSASGERETVQCNCPGGIKPPPMHAPNCPVRSRHASLIDPYDGGTWVAPSLGIDAPEQHEQPRYRLLGTADIIQDGDEFIDDDGVHWNGIAGWERGMRWGTALKTGRRRIDAPLRTHPAAQQGDKP